MEIKRYASGGYVKKHPSGSYTRVSPSGTITYHAASGYTETTSPRGSKTIHHVTGKVERKSPWDRNSYSPNPTRSKKSKRNNYDEPTTIEKVEVADVHEAKPTQPRFTSTKSALANDNKENLLKKHHKSKNVYGIDIYSFTDPKSGEEKWLAYANPSVLKTHDNKYESTEEFVVLGINDENNTNDYGRALMPVKGYLNSDIAILYEVVFDENETASIDAKNCFVVHIKSGEMIPLTSRQPVWFSSDGEKMCIQNPFATDQRYDIYSTRVDNQMLQSHVDPNEMI